jgi:hypothetical protein
MNSHSGKNDNNKDRTVKAIATAIPIAGIVVAAAFLSGLSLINSYQPAIAQNMTGNATTTPPTTGGSSAQSACAPTTTGGGGGQNATTNATTTATTGGSSANATADNATTATNATSAIGGGIPSASEVREHIEEACTAAQSNDTEGVLLHLNLALNALGGNMTTTEGGEDEDEDEGGATTGGEDEGEAEG